MLFKNQTLCCDDEHKHSTMPWMFIEIFADISLVKAEIPLVTWFKWVYALVRFTKKKNLVMIFLKSTIWFVQINIHVKHYLKLIVNSASQIITNWKLQVTIYVCLYQVETYSNKWPSTVHYKNVSLPTVTTLVDKHVVFTMQRGTFGISKFVQTWPLLLAYSWSLLKVILAQLKISLAKIHPAFWAVSLCVFDFKSY